MALKIRKNFSFRNVGDAIDDIFIDAVNQLGNHLNLSIQKGLEKSKDIHGHSFEDLKPSTKARRTQSNPRPLLDKGADNPRALNALRTIKKNTCYTI